jgi:uncharacterized protein YcbK (DUF882 family)
MAGSAPKVPFPSPRAAPAQAIFSHFRQVLNAGRGAAARHTLTLPDKTVYSTLPKPIASGGAGVGRRISRKIAVSVGAWRGFPLVSALARAGARFGVAGLVLLGANNSLQNAVAESDTRTLSFHHVHTDEDITVTFKRNGRYDEAALKKLDWFMRDWRKEQEAHMDPHLFDLLWETYRDVGATEPIQVLCGYRSPGTNAMLRARSSGVAQFSQHINGNAIDFYIPGVPVAKVRAEGLRLQRGGVGFYPTSGSPFVHMDTGTIRHWPRIAREELKKIFPNGRTVHIPADGKPLPGYALALADVERHGNMPNERSLEAAHEAGVLTASQERAAERPRRSLLARIFGIGSDEDEHSEPPAPKSAHLHARAPMALASLSPPKPVAVARIVPMPAAWQQPAAVAAILPKPRPAEQKIVTAALPDNVFDNRSYWRSAVESGPDLPPPIVAGTRFETAALDPASTGSTGVDALAYATESDTWLAALAHPMGSRLPRMPAEAQVIPVSPNTSVVVKPPLAASLAMSGGKRSEGPWLRAAMLTPSVRNFMTANRVGATDPRWQDSLLHKPPQSVVRTFSTDPHLGMVADRFTGTAVVFMATITFTPQTLSMR